MVTTTQAPTFDRAARIITDSEGRRRTVDEMSANLIADIFDTMAHEADREQWLVGFLNMLDEERGRASE